MKKNIIISSVVSSLLVAWMVGFSASADDTNTWSVQKNFKSFGFERGIWDFDNKWFKNSLTEEEKTELKDMSKEEKKAFFDSKMTEQKVQMETKRLKMQAQENIIDKLLAWTALTSEEETIRIQIIKDRSERKAQMETRIAQKAEINAIIAKKKAWETLTTEEKAKIKDMRWNKKMWEKKWFWFHK